MSNALGLSAFVGALLAWPTYYHMFFRLSGEAGTALHHDGLPLAMAAANFLLLFPLALAGMRAMKSASVWLLPVGAAGLLLLVFAVLIHLPKGNEHSLSNAAQCLLAIPAGGAIAAWQNRSRIPAAMALAAFLPVTAGTLLAFGSRPTMPIAVNGMQLVRLPLDGDLQRFYEWARNHTPRETVFLSDPATPVKMSGDVSELPAFTARAQFTDTPNLTTPYPDAAFRHELAAHAARGDELAAAERAYLARLRRPLYLVTYQANRTDLVSRLSAQYGTPDFHQGIVAVFRIARLDGAVR
jgi:hypothetical protein